MAMKPLVRILVLAACTVLAGVACEKKPAPTPPAPPPDRPKAAAPETPAPSPDNWKPAGLADDATLVKELRAGGYILAMRHTHTDMNQKDEQGTNYDDCAKQRNLDAKGRSDAKAIGEAFKAIGIPVAVVYSSPFCRNKETAQLAFGEFSINPACMNEDGPSIAARNQLLGTAPPAGKNVVLVTHKSALAASTGSTLDTLVEGGALVIKPKGDGTFELVHTIDMSDWERLAKVAAAPK
jgi:phosphohistidine phosphatase SixA